MELFLTGLHQPSDAQHFDLCFVSVERLWKRKSDFKVGEDGLGKVVLDSGAFGRLFNGKDHRPVEEYAAQIRKWNKNGKLLAAVSQDYMCEPFILKRTGLTVADHQRLTIERYDALLRQETGCYIMPVLQGYRPEEYVEHIRMYGDRLKPGMWVGVGSVCKRNGSPQKILDVLMVIKMVRPDLRLHGFGVKIKSLDKGLLRALLYSADSMAWSFAARYAGTGANDWHNADKFRKRVSIQPEYQGHFLQLQL
jgi:hypothetical protein